VSYCQVGRRPEGVAVYVGQGAPGRHFGRWLCLNCPRDHHDPPFLPFARPGHIREHRRLYPRHAIAWWCWDHLVIEEVHTTGWRWVYAPVMSPDPDVREEVAMCSYRRVKVRWPDGRELVTVVREDPDKPVYCDPCQMSLATFRARDLLPHDNLGHLEVYGGAKVTRGRRLSAAQAAHFGAREYEPRPGKKPWQPSMPGVLVDAETQE